MSRLVGPQHMGVALGLQRIAAKQVMLAKNPKVARAGHRRGPSIDRGQFVFLVEAAAVQKNVDLAHLEATDLELDLRCKFQDFGELEGRAPRGPMRTSSVMRLSARRSIRSSASDRSVRLTAGTSLRPSCRAASTSPQPATTRRSASIRIGKTKPNRSRLAASLRTCCGGCLRVSRPRGLQSAIGHQAGASDHVKGHSRFRARRGLSSRLLVRFILSALQWTHRTAGGMPKTRGLWGPFPLSLFVVCRNLSRISNSDKTALRAFRAVSRETP